MRRARFRRVLIPAKRTPLPWLWSNALTSCSLMKPMAARLPLDTQTKSSGSLAAIGFINEQEVSALLQSQGNGVRFAGIKTLLKRARRMWVCHSHDAEPVRFQRVANSGGWLRRVPTRLTPRAPLRVL